MKTPFKLIASIVQLVFGLAAVAAFFLLRSAGEDSSRWTITLMLAIAFVIMGIGGLVEYFKKN